MLFRFIAAVVVAGAMPLAMAEESAPRSREPDLEAIVPMALSPANGVAIVMYPDRTMKTVRIGDLVSASQARVKSIMTDRLVLDEARGSTAPQLVWLFKPQSPGQPPVIKRLGSSAPRGEPVATQLSGSSSMTGASGKAGTTSGTFTSK